MTTTRTELLVVGAGPTGLALACLGRRAGLDVRLIDKSAGPSTTSKAIGLQYRVSEVLACMGVVDRFLERGASPAVVNMWEGERRLVRLRFDLAGRPSGRDAFSPLPIMIPQSETEAILGDVLRERGGDIEWGTELVRFEQDQGAVTSIVRRPEGEERRISSEWLVSCEGAHSTIRKLAGIPFKGKTYPLAFLLADVEIDWDLPAGENHVWGTADGALAAFPMPREGLWRLILQVPSDSEPSPGGVTIDRLREVLAERVGATGIELGELIWQSEFRISARMVDDYRKGRVFLAGDAAHTHSPTGGQGITTCMQDATNLAWKLARVRGGAPETLLDTYTEERRPHAAEVLAATDRMTGALSRPGPW